jgi:hypothetical protein
MNDQERRKYDNDQFVEFYMVWTKPDRIHVASKFSPKKSYNTLAQAEEVCRVMADRFKGKKFFVVKAVHRELVPVEVGDDA